MIHRLALLIVLLLAGLPGAWSEELPGSPDILPPVVLEAIEEGNAAFAKQDYKRAQSAYQMVLQVTPRNLLALVNLGLTEFYLGNPDEAESLLLRAVREKLETSPAWLVLGMIYLDTGRLPEALAALANANLYDSRNARARNFLGVTIGEMGWFDGAESEFRQAIEIDPNYVDAHYNLAHFCLRRRQPAVELARRHYLRALELGAERDSDIEARLKADPPAP